MKQRPTPAWLFSLVVHVVLGAGLVQVLVVPLRMFDRRVATPPTVEHISYVAMPHVGPDSAARAGGDGATVSKHKAAPLIAPRTIPTGVPAAPAAPSSTEPAGGSGPVVGIGGPLVGIQPSFADPRVWVRPGPVVGLPKTTKERFDSALSSRFAVYMDSVAAVTHVPNKLENKDWTFTRNGQKFGIDSQYIRLGKLSIPNAVLALLPLNSKLRGNPIANEREGRINAISAEIAFQSQRRMNEAEFRTEVKRIRERKEREERARQSPQPNEIAGEQRNN